MNGTFPVTICFSGGIDSTSLIQYYLIKDYKIQLFFIDYSQPSLEGEWLAAENIASHYKLPLIRHKMNLAFSSEKTNGELIGRNAMLLFTALIVLELSSGLISFGIHDGSPYYDSSNIFISHMQSILNGYLGGKLILDAPFIRFHKLDIIEFGKKEKVPLRLTYSCENQSGDTCGTCLSCKERKKHGIDK